MTHCWYSELIKIMKSVVSKTAREVKSNFVKDNFKPSESRKSAVKENAI